MLKRFIYFEAQEGGMDSFEFSAVDGLSGLSGWMDDDCKDSDIALSEWIESSEIGEYFEHRLGTAVRLKDA